MNYTWSVVFSVLFGAGCGVAFAYSNPQFFISKAKSSVLLGAVIFAIPFTIYFSIEKNPLLTHFFYFLPVFGVVYYYVSSLIIQQVVDDEDARIWNERKEARREEEQDVREAQRDERQESKEKRESARNYRKHVGDLDDLDLDERIKALKEENRW